MSGTLIGMVLALNLESISGWVCSGAALLLLLVIVGAISGSKKKKRGSKTTKKPTRFEAWEESDKRNQQIIGEAYRHFDRVSADEVRTLAKRLGPDAIGEPPKYEREELRNLASAKRLDNATTIRQMISVWSELQLNDTFMDALQSRLAARVGPMLVERWEKLEARTSKKITEKVLDDWEKFVSDLDELCQGDLRTGRGPIHDLIWSWYERVEQRYREVEEKAPE